MRRAKPLMRTRAGALLATVALAVVLAFGSGFFSADAVAAPTESAEVQAVATETADGSAAAAEGEAAAEEPVEEIIEDEDVPLGVRRTVALNRNIKPVIIAGVIVAIVGFGIHLLRVNRNIDKMNRHIR